MTIRPHVGARYRYRENGSDAWSESALSAYVTAQSEAAVLAAIFQRRPGVEVELLEVRWKKM
jgi:hypothetical protein